jgi:diadenosine tetraphosphatase ApaH/serine/threonine PP2A family protein phosphatase
MFDYLPLVAIVENHIYCVHGGLSPSITTIDEVKKIDRI